MPPPAPIARVESSVIWQTGFGKRAQLGEGDLFVLRADLNPSPQCIEVLGNLLSEVEIRRAMRYKFDLHRNRFIASHGLLREILGRLLRVDPREIVFAQGDKGKPQLGGKFSDSDLRFNLSKSEDRLALAVTRSRRIGVDIEFMMSSKADTGVAETHFSPNERADLETLQGKDWEAGFFNCWTRKEAFIKATGEGLYRPLDSFDVTLIPGQPAELRSIDGSAADAGHWKLLDIPFGEGFAGAVVAEGREWELICWDYPS